MQFAGHPEQFAANFSGGAVHAAQGTHIVLAGKEGSCFRAGNLGLGDVSPAASFDARQPRFFAESPEFTR
jgi:hypothetical protein